MSNDILIPTGPLHRWVVDLWLAAGSCDREARLAADHLVGANLAGHDSHGVGMVDNYVLALLDGELQLNQGLTMVTDSGPLLVVDGNRGLGQALAFEAMALAIDRAQRHGVAVVGLRNVHHIGRVGHWAEQAMAAGLASIHFTNVVGRPMVAPYGGSQSRLGTNPLTVGLPRRDGPSILLDYASSAIALGKAQVAYHRGVPAPAGTLIDQDGNPTTDPAVMFESPLGALLPAAGHKGYALAMVCDLLGSALFGGGTMRSQPSSLAGLFNNMLAIVFDPARFGTTESFEHEAASFIAYVQSTRLSVPGEPIQIPGDYERRCRVERAELLPISAVTLDRLDSAARSLNSWHGTSLPPASALASAAARQPYPDPDGGPPPCR